MIVLYIFVHYISDFSLSEWVKDNGLDINDLSESTIHFLLEELGIAEHFTGDKCDNTRTPYMPSILGWRNGRLYTMAYNFVFFRIPCSFNSQKYSNVSAINIIQGEKLLSNI